MYVTTILVSLRRLLSFHVSRRPRSVRQKGLIRRHGQLPRLTPLNSCSATFHSACRAGPTFPVDVRMQCQKHQDPIPPPNSTVPAIRFNVTNGPNGVTTGRSRLRSAVQANLVSQTRLSQSLGHRRLGRQNHWRTRSCSPATGWPRNQTRPDPFRSACRTGGAGGEVTGGKGRTIYIQVFG
jgi:hypothetical protein